MDSAHEQFAAIGFGVTARQPDCWQIERIGGSGPASPAGPGDPAHSRALARWRRRLASRRLPPGYRISRI